MGSSRAKQSLKHSRRASTRGVMMREVSHMCKSAHNMLERERQKALSALTEERDQL